MNTIKVTMQPQYTEDPSLYKALKQANIALDKAKCRDIIEDLNF